MFVQLKAAGSRLQVFRSLRHRNFRWLWFNTSTFAIAQGMQFLTIGWLVLRETDDSPFQVGLVIFLFGLPNMFCMIPGGILADRVNRPRLLTVSQAIVAVLLFAFAIITMADVVKMWHIYGIVFILGILQGLNLPARITFVANLVPREDTMNAVALNMAVMNTGRIVGPGIAGGVIALAGIAPALYLNAAFYIVGAACLLPISGISQVRVVGNSTVLSDLKGGLRYFWSAPVALSIVGIGLAFSFFGNTIIHLMPAFGKEVLEVGAGKAGLLITAAGVGSVVGTLTLASVGDFRHKGWWLLAAIFLFVLALGLFAWSPSYWVSWAILVFVGMGSMTYVSLATTVLLLTTPSDVQGRILSLWTLGAAVVFVGALPMGLIADVTDSWPIAVTVGACACLVITLWLGVWRPALRHLGV